MPLSLRHLSSAASEGSAKSKSPTAKAAPTALRTSALFIVSRPLACQTHRQQGSTQPPVSLRPLVIGVTWSAMSPLWVSSRHSGALIANVRFVPLADVGRLRMRSYRPVQVRLHGYETSVSEA